RISEALKVHTTPEHVAQAKVLEAAGGGPGGGGKNNASGASKATKAGTPHLRFLQRVRDSTKKLIRYFRSTNKDNWTIVFQNLTARELRNVLSRFSDEGISTDQGEGEQQTGRFRRLLGGAQKKAHAG
ncbi:unnamed protein product, partial [Amoebophrya sp. A120]